MIQVDLFAGLEPGNAMTPKPMNVFAQVVIAAREQNPKLWPHGFKRRPYGGFCDRITDPAVPSQHDDWPALFYTYCYVRPHAVAATLNLGYIDRAGEAA